VLGYSGRFGLCFHPSSSSAHPEYPNLFLLFYQHISKQQSSHTDQVSQTTPRSKFQDWTFSVTVGGGESPGGRIVVVGVKVLYVHVLMCKKSFYEKYIRRRCSMRGRESSSRYFEDVTQKVMYGL